MRLLLIAALLPLGACQSNWEKTQDSQASGPRATRSFQLSGFDGVELRGPDDVEVKTGATFSVTAEGDASVLDQLDIRVEGGRLKVGRKPGHTSGTSRDATIRVVMPRVTAASVAGSGDLSVDKAEGAFDGAVAGSGDLDIASLAATQASLSLAGSGDLSVKGGSAQSLSVSIAGSGDIDAAGLRATSADVSIAGSGNLRAMVNGPAKVAIVGSGDAELSGGAKCQVSKIGSGEARCS